MDAKTLALHGLVCAFATLGFADERASQQLETRAAFGARTSLAIESPMSLHELAGEVARELAVQYEAFEKIFGPIPELQTTVKLMEEERFFRATGAPRWTNALYLNDEILIPIPKKGVGDKAGIHRALKHELTHAIVHRLSRGRCPGWFDEGIAQWTEGEEHPALRPALLAYLKRAEPLSLLSLRSGFTRIREDAVAAAYAQSLLSARNLIEKRGVAPVRRYLDALGSGATESSAFLQAFGMRESTFDERMKAAFRSWSRGQAKGERAQRHWH